jgi:UDP-N-acetylmuramoylalanine--D-glutamate ligase
VTGAAVEDADVVTRGPAYLASLTGTRVVVVGLARSGVAAARLLASAGAHVVATDAKPREALSAEARALERLGVRVVAPREEPLRDAELVVVSPGVPLDGEQLVRARSTGIPIISELELGWRATEAETLAITGTNGKTTTTTLTGALLASGPRRVVVAGNIGTPLAAEAPRIPPDGLVVLEVSSFQLEATEHFRPRVAALLNLAPDHLDRHRTFARYVEAKARIFANQTGSDCAVLNADDEAIRALAPRLAAEVVWFSRRRVLEHGVFVRDAWIVARRDAHTTEVAPLAEITLRGQHNVENVLAATACALWSDVEPAAIRAGIGRFRAVAHRIEFVRELGGVQYYNDSKGTNVESTIKALESFAEPVVLIAGGKGKGQDFAPLAATARGRVRLAVLIGEDAVRIAAVLDPAGVPVARAASLEEAIALARTAAVPGDVVLLSPACASFDMFANFEHRGDVFTQLVRGLQ